MLAESQDICSWWNFDISNFPFHSKLEENQVFFMFPVNAPENNNSRLAHMTVPLIRRKDMFLVSSITVSVSPQKVTFQNISFSRAVSILHPHLTTIFWCKDIKNKIAKSTLHQRDMAPLWHINYSLSHTYTNIFSTMHFITNIKNYWTWDKRLPSLFFSLSLIYSYYPEHKGNKSFSSKACDFCFLLSKHLFPWIFSNQKSS